MKMLCYCLDCNASFWKIFRDLKLNLVQTHDSLYALSDKKKKKKKLNAWAKFGLSIQDEP